MYAEEKIGTSSVHIFLAILPFLRSLRTAEYSMLDFPLVL